MFSHFLVTVVVVLYALRTCAGGACDAKKPCKNGGTCNDGASEAYTCVCPPTFYGKNCESTNVCKQYHKIPINYSACSNPEILWYSFDNSNNRCVPFKACRHNIIPSFSDKLLNKFETMEACVNKCGDEPKKKDPKVTTTLSNGRALTTAAANIKFILFAAVILEIFFAPGQYVQG